MVFKKEKEIDENFRLNEKVIANQYIIDGKVKVWKGEFFEVVSPIRIKKEDGSLKKVVVGKFPLMDEKFALEMLNSAKKAYEDRNGWSCLCVEKRIEYFEKFIENLKKYREECIKVLMWEIAKSLKDATSEFDRTVEYLENSLEELKEMQRKSIAKKVENLIAVTKRSPLGVVFAMGPYNYPLNETFATIMPALMMGNTVIVKPPKRGSLIYKYVIKAAEDVFPAGVFSVLFGRGSVVVEPIMRSGKVSVFAFIGSHKTANMISKFHPKPNRLKLIYGLDAKNLAIVLPCANLDVAVSECVLGSLSYNGQRCTAIKMIYVHKDVEKKFIEKYLKKVDELKSGLPFDNANITPCPDERIGYFCDLMEDALAKGAKTINKPLKDEESFFSVKVLSNISEDMRIFKEEQFGPIVPILSFDTLKEPMRTIENSDFGQQCSVFGTNQNDVGHLVDFLINQVSRVNINAQCQRGPDVLPFTGRKDSAVGTLSVKDALKAFSIRTLVTLKLNEENKDLFKKLNEGKSQFLKNEVLF